MKRHAYKQNNSSKSKYDGSKKKAEYFNNKYDGSKRRAAYQENFTVE